MSTDLPHLLPGKTRKILEIALALLVLCVAAWVPRDRGLYLYVTTDENLWLTRSAQFYYAILHQDYAATYQKEHPGVTIMWAGAAAFARLAPKFRDRPVMQLNAEQFANYLSLVDDTSFLNILVAGRSYLVLANIHLRLRNSSALLDDLNKYLELRPKGPEADHARQMREQVLAGLANVQPRQAPSTPRP